MDNPCALHLRDEQHLAALCLALIDDPSVLSPAESDLVSQAAGPVTAGEVAAVLAGVNAGTDPLGDEFCRLRPGPARRDLGQFYTPPHIVTAMVRWTLARQPAAVVDAGAGSGRYTLEVRRQGFAGELVAVDLDPLATLMTRATLAAAGHTATVVCGSFLDTVRPDVDGTVGWVGNPPYLRHHNLPASAKRWAKTTAAALGLEVSGLAGLHVLFFLAVAAQARPGDSCSFITSSEWTDARTAGIARTMLSRAELLPLERIDAVDPTATTFDDALTTAIVTCSVAGTTGPALVRTVGDPGALAELAGGTPLDLATLESANRWEPLLGGRAAQVESGTVPLAQYVSVRRGLATGANRFFVLTTADADAHGLSSYARPCVSRAAELLSVTGHIEAADTRKVMLVLPDHLEDPAVAAYVAAGEAQKLHTGHICSHRKPWWKVPPVPQPAAFVTVMARRPPAFVRNSDGVTHTNTVHGIYPREGVSDADVTLLLDWLNANGAKLSGGRTFHGGLQKWEPKDVEAIRVPPLEALRAGR